MVFPRDFAPRRGRGGGGVSGVVLTTLATVLCTIVATASASASAAGAVAGETCSSASDDCAAGFECKCGGLNPVGVLEMKVTLGGYAAATDDEQASFRQGRPRPDAHPSWFRVSEGFRVSQGFSRVS